MKLSAINCFPIKSCQAVSVDSCQVQPRGIQFDRRYLVVDNQNRAITGRENSALSLLKVTAHGSGIAVSTDDGPLEIPLPSSDARPQTVTIWSDTVTASDLGDTVATQLSRLLDDDVRLVYMDDAVVRDIEEAYPHEQALPVSFADNYPMLIVNEASTQDLSKLAGESIDQRRFRANLSVTGAPEWDEDDWYKVRIGEVLFDVAMPCGRCKFTTRDPDTAQIHAQQEPLRTLARHRRGEDGEVYFGQNLVPVDTGEIRVGDPVTVEQRGPKRPVLKQT